jgi:hypothetical protein
MAPPVSHFELRGLPLASRLVIAAFLVSAGIGYFAALVQLHFRNAAPGDALPGLADLESTYSPRRERAVSQVERLLEAEEGPLNGSGSMRPAFTDESDGWRVRTRDKTPEQIRRLRAEREGERLALLSWVRSGAGKEAYDKDDFPLGRDLADREITAEFLVRQPTDQPSRPTRVRIRSLVTARCVTCHAEDGRNEHARFVPLDTYDRLQAHCRVPAGRTAHTLPELAQTTHTHLLGFAVLFGLVGGAFSFTSYPGWVRAVVGPFPLIVQVVNIGCWWLARLDPLFIRAIHVTGVLVALGLAFQIVAALFDIFGRVGKCVLLLLLVASCFAGYVVQARIVAPFLDRERQESLAPP